MLAGPWSMLPITACKSKSLHLRSTNIIIEYCSGLQNRKILAGPLSMLPITACGGLLTAAHLIHHARTRAERFLLTPLGEPLKPELSQLQSCTTPPGNSHHLLLSNTCRLTQVEAIPPACCGRNVNRVSFCCSRLVGWLRPASICNHC